MGAMLSMTSGTIIYCATQAAGFKIFDLHRITIGITYSLILFLIGSYFAKKSDEATLEIFFPKKFILLQKSEGDFFITAQSLTALF